MNLIKSDLIMSDFICWNFFKLIESESSIDDSIYWNFLKLVEFEPHLLLYYANETFLIGHEEISEFLLYKFFAFLW